MHAADILVAVEKERNRNANSFAASLLSCHGDGRLDIRVCGGAYGDALWKTAIIIQLFVFNLPSRRFFCVDD